MEKEGEQTAKRKRQDRVPRESMDELLKQLKLAFSDLENGHVVSDKEFPETATDFFDQISSWFSSVVQTKQQQIDQQAGKPHMYQ